MNAIKAFLRFVCAAITYIICVIFVIILMFAQKAQASDAVDYPHYRHTDFYVGFANTETTVAEASWQALNIIDTMQTIQTAKNPACYKELGQMSIVSEHPSVKEVYIGMAVFSVAHYLVAKGLDHLVIHDQNYMVLQRIYQYTGLVFKGYSIGHNASIGLGLNHSKSCK